MTKKTIRNFVAAIMFSVFATSAHALLPMADAAAIEPIVTELGSILTTDTLAIKKGVPYDEANDPVFQQSKPEDGPQHGYFAVPMLVLGLAGILLYFSRND